MGKGPGCAIAAEENSCSAGIAENAGSVSASNACTKTSGV